MQCGKHMTHIGITQLGQLMIYAYVPVGCSSFGASENSFDAKFLFIYIVWVYGRWYFRQNESIFDEYSSNRKMFEYNLSKDSHKWIQS